MEKDWELTYSWDELQYALSKSFKKYPSGDVTGYKKVSFMKAEDKRKHAITLTIQGIDNKYGVVGKPMFHWEIYLFEDGTWKIL